MALWANLHGGWVIGFAWLGIAIASELGMWVLDRPIPRTGRTSKFLGIITAASAVAVLATPHGLSVYLYPFNTVGSVAQEKLIVEWFSPDFHQRYLLPFEAMILITIGGFALRRPSLYEFLLVVAAARARAAVGAQHRAVRRGHDPGPDQHVPRVVARARRDP